MKKSKRKLYDNIKLNDFRELVSRYENLYADKTAFIYKKDPHDKEKISISYSTFANDIKALRNSFVTPWFTR